MVGMQISFTLEGRNALVCGGTAGIGQAIAIAFAEAGAAVTVMGRSEERLQATLERLAGTGHQALRADFSDLSQVESAIAERAARGPLHVVVNNTGGPAAGRVSETHHEPLVDAFRMHVATAQVILAAVLPGMKAEGYGRVINVISTSVITPILGLGVSNTVRGAMANWGRTMAAELGEFGITVNNLLPGFTDTDRLSSLFEGKAKRLGTTPQSVRDQALATIPLGRIGAPEELAAAALFLASPAGGYVSGVNLPVDGGRVCKG